MFFEFLNQTIERKYHVIQTILHDRLSPFHANELSRVQKESRINGDELLFHDYVIKYHDYEIQFHDREIKNHNH